MGAAIDGVSPGGPIAVAPVPRKPDHSGTLELRLALVCYGGVSLAIYMHGVTKEIQKLVAASKAYEEDQDDCPWDASATEHAYWHALRERERRDSEGVRTRVVVDVIAGTSAGGINGVVLAKALARDLPQEGLREVWVDCGDIKKLMAVPRLVPFLPLKGLAWLTRNAILAPKPPLDGNRMFGWIHQALESMDKDDRGGTLMPPMHPLELFVTVTDFHGYNRRVPAYDPKRVSDLRHRHAMVFAHGSGRDQLDRGHNPELTFAARATSSFPGAFPPINVANIGENLPGWDGLERFKREFWSIYPLSGADVENAYFIDGGVLDNFPFRHAIDAIRRRPAALEVDRRLVYIEPDPKGLAEAPTGESPRWGETIWGGLAGIRGHEPVLDDLLEVRKLNERIDRIREIVAAGLAEIPQLAAGEPGESYEDVGARVNAEAAERAGFAYTSYVQLKLHAVVERFAELACEVCEFPPDSNHAFFVGDVLMEWARRGGILEPAPQPTDLQRAFLRDFDLGYGDRRIRFAIKYLSGLYRGDHERPTRAELNDAKRRLYAHLGTLSAAAAGAGAGDPGERVRRLFRRDVLDRYMDSDESPEDSVADFLRRFGTKVDRAQEALRGFLGQALGDFGRTVYDSMLEMSEDWDEPVRSELLARYTGFPFWDVVIFPLQAVADVGELNRVEVVRFSPEDVGILKVPRQKGERPTAKEKLRGVPLGHFAAFFGRDRRENDYLWGRLDAVERLVCLLLGNAAPEISKPAFKAILDEEEPRLTKIGDVFEDLRSQLAQ